MLSLPRRARKHVRMIMLVHFLVFASLAVVLVQHDHRDQAFLSPQDADSTCRSHGFKLYKNRSRKVYDLTLFATELDWLEIRLQSLAPYVDYFVVVESDTTFTGKPKPLYLQENWSRFKDFHHKIIHKVVHDPIASTRIWDHEDWFRNSLLNEVLPGLQGTRAEISYGDALVVGDMDEIVRPGVMMLLRHCNFPARLVLHTDFFYYSFQWRHRGPQWAHPDATIYQGALTIPPNDLRQGLLGPGWLLAAAFRRWWDRGALYNAGWHCSSCFATVDEMRKKMHGFSHQGWNTGYNRDAGVMMDRVRNGKDLFGRPTELYDRVENNEDIPPYVLQQYREHGRFKYMLDRDGEDAGFEDWQSAMAHE
ncbi:unnamed protein product [Zymoseptoria tritici ST99CH_1A5]|uniref:Glycosyl transferase family 17 protein n=3 Tax=Zymoseptoria tritici TaxID=1047171 RepID=A0A2H1G3J2_ZYMTR|nr:unnamed protein product [Zymoseptoria tritici ST99CH_1E4]SMR49333.1 unnamed protein product [Zymoseptoria tritici ST99CH_3D1]SMY22033.1 unnamed protein product [Zymoseptoria tritici ST99CH_1A5]